MGDGNEEEAMSCDRFQRGGGGEAAPLCRRGMTQRIATRSPWRLKAVDGVWRSKMKRNWVGGSNARLGRTADWVSEKNMAESIRWVRKIGEGILVGQNRKEKRK
jgi:hypothetical protein